MDEYDSNPLGQPRRQSAGAWKPSCQQTWFRKSALCRLTEGVSLALDAISLNLAESCPRAFWNFIIKHSFAQVTVSYTNKQHLSHKHWWRQTVLHLLTALYIKRHFCKEDFVRRKQILMICLLTCVWCQLHMHFFCWCFAQGLDKYYFRNHRSFIYSAFSLTWHCRWGREQSLCAGMTFLPSFYCVLDCPLLNESDRTCVVLLL